MLNFGHMSLFSSQNLRKSIVIFLTFLAFFTVIHTFLLAFPQTATAVSNQSPHHDIDPHDANIDHSSCPVNIHETTSVRTSHDIFSSDQVPCIVSSYAVDLFPLLNFSFTVLVEEDIPPDLPLDQKTNLLL